MEYLFKALVIGEDHTAEKVKMQLKQKKNAAHWYMYKYMGLQKHVVTKSGPNIWNTRIFQEQSYLCDITTMIFSMQKLKRKKRKKVYKISDFLFNRYQNSTFSFKIPIEVGRIVRLFVDKHSIYNRKLSPLIGTPNGRFQKRDYM